MNRIYSKLLDLGYDEKADHNFDSRSALRGIKVWMKERRFLRKERKMKRTLIEIHRKINKLNQRRINELDKLYGKKRR